MCAMPGKPSQTAGAEGPSVRAGEVHQGLFSATCEESLSSYRAHNFVRHSKLVRRSSNG